MRSHELCYRICITNSNVGIEKMKSLFLPESFMFPTSSAIYHLNSVLEPRSLCSSYQLLFMDFFLNICADKKKFVPYHYLSGLFSSRQQNRQESLDALSWTNERLYWSERSNCWVKHLINSFSLKMINHRL